MTSDLDERTRRWRRRLAFIYWSLSPLLFPLFVRLFFFPIEVASALLGHAPPWSRWVVLAYLVFACVCAGATLWFLWSKLRELPPPIGS